jgi:hypothetical protein
VRDDEAHPRNSVSILIREEDFTEITVGLEEISYLRPSGGKATIKFPQNQK